MPVQLVAHGRRQAGSPLPSPLHATLTFVIQYIVLPFTEPHAVGAATSQGQRDAFPNLHKGLMLVIDLGVTQKERWQMFEQEGTTLNL